MEAIGNVTAGIYLDRLQRKIAKKVAHERKKALEGLEHVSEKTLEKASYEFSLRIGQMREAYSEEMNKTIDKIDPLIREKINQIRDAIDAFSGVVEDSAQILSDGSLMFSNNWVLSSHVPQVTSMNPNAVYGNIDMPIKFRGNFVAQGKYRLILEEREIVCETGLTNQLEFLVPKELFSSLTQSKSLKGKLIIPMPLRFPSKLCKCLIGQQFAIFPVALAAFPIKMGKITLENGINNQKEEIEFPWGGSVIRSVQPRAWKVFLRTFNESHYELAPVRLACHFLKVKDFGDTITIDAVLPRAEMLSIPVQEAAVEVAKPKPLPSPPNTPPTVPPPPISDFRRQLGVLPLDIQASSFQNFGRNCPQELKNYTYLYNEHINKPGTREIRWARDHKVAAIYKSGKWRFYWVGPPCGASFEGGGSFEAAFNVYKPKYLEQANIPFLSKL